MTKNFPKITTTHPKRLRVEVSFVPVGAAKSLAKFYPVATIATEPDDASLATTVGLVKSVFSKIKTALP